MAGTLDKRAIVGKIVAALAAELAGYERSARAAHAEATDEQSKAENKYDTRGLEASYLAQGQSRQAAEIVQAMQQYESLPVAPLGANESIQIGALVELKRGSERTVYFMGPRAGGTEVECDGETILVITPQSPIGLHLMGKRQGESLSIKLDRTLDAYHITTVS